MLSLPRSATPLTLGTAVSGTLNPGTPRPSTASPARPARRCSSTTRPLPGTAVNLLLIDPYNNRSQPQLAPRCGPLTLTAGGTYYLLVDGRIVVAGQLPVPADRHFDRTALLRHDDERHASAPPRQPTSTPSPARPASAFYFEEPERFQRLLLAPPGYLNGPNNQLITSSLTSAHDLTATLPIAAPTRWSSPTPGTAAREPTASRPSRTSTRPRLDPGPGGDRHDRQPGRRGHLHLHRLGRPADLFDGLGSATARLSRRAHRPLRQPSSTSNRPSATGPLHPEPCRDLHPDHLRLGTSGAYDFALDDARRRRRSRLATGTGRPAARWPPASATNLYQFSGTGRRAIYFEGLEDSPPPPPSPTSTARPTATSRTLPGVSVR